MSRDENIFYRLIKNENSMTEALCNLLAYKEFREFFLKIIIPENLVNDIDYSHCDTQTRLNETGQPDLIVENNNTLIVVEVKTGDSILTDKQPKSYISYIKNSKCHNSNKYLVFLVPKNYFMLKEWKDRVELQGFQNSNSIIIFWENLIDRLEASGLPKQDPRIYDFCELAKSWYVSAPIFFDKKDIKTMFDNRIPQVLKKLKGVIDSVYSESMKAGIPVEKTKNQYEYYVWFPDNNRESILFLSLWYEFWEKERKPLCFGVKKNHKVKEYVSQFDRKYRTTKNYLVDFEGYSLSWFDEETFEDKLNCDANEVGIRIFNHIKPLIKAD